MTAVSLWAALGTAVLVRADTFHLEGGERIECEVLEDLGAAYRIRTLIGIVELQKDRIVEHEKGPSPWQLYRKKRGQCPNTAEGHYGLAEWCGEHGLRPERIEQLETVVRLDPDHADARRALGYVRQKGAWIKPRSPKAPTPEEIEARRAARAAERLLRKLISQWFVKVKAIHRGRMTGPKATMQSKKFRQGRELILAIRDPLALPALTGVLSTGNVASRRVLIESLSQFDEDEATMNLLVMTLLDPAPQIRELAATELVRRDDQRVVEHLRSALGSDEGQILRNAAVALGILRARGAVIDLVSVLSTEARQWVRISRPVYLDGIRAAFGGGCRRRSGSRLLFYRPSAIGVLGSGTLVGTETRYEVRTVSIYRTEVQEALIAITGQNFGFDIDAWLRWWQDQQE